MCRATAFLFALVVVLPAAAQNADLTLQLTPDARYNAGEIATVRAKVTNLGPDTATAAGVRLTKPAQHFGGAMTFRVSGVHRHGALQYRHAESWRVDMG